MAAQSPGTPLVVRVEDARRQISALRGSTNSGALLTLLLGLLALAALSFYFWYGHNQIQEFTDPKTLTSMGQQLLDDRVPELRKQAEEEIVKRSPELARTLSEQAIAHMPAARERLVEFASEQIQKALDEGELVSGEQFRRLVQRHRDMLERDVQDLASNPELSEERFKELVDMIDQDLGIGIKDKSEVALGMVFALNENLDRLAPGRNLSPLDARLREYLMVVRRVQQTKNLGGMEPAIGERATIRSADAPQDDAEPTPDDLPIGGDTRKAGLPPGAERLQGLKPAGDAGAEAKPGDDAPKE